MAFDVNQYFKTKGGNIGSDAASLREAATALSAAKGFSNNETYRSAADTALNILSGVTEGIRKNSRGEDLNARDIARARSFLTGQAQPTRFGKVWSGYSAVQNDLKSKAGTLQSNIANVLDFSGGNVSAADQAALKAKAAGMQGNLDILTQQAKQTGTTFAEPIKTASGFIPAMSPTDPRANTPAALRAQGQETAAYAAVGKNPDGTPMKAPPPPPTPTPIDNVVNAEQFVNEPSTVSVGGTHPLATGTKSPIFVQGQDLYYIPAGGTAPVKISGPAELSNLAASGAIEVNGQRQALTNASTFLNGQTPVAAPAGGSDFLSTIGQPGSGL